MTEAGEDVESARVDYLPRWRIQLYYYQQLELYKKEVLKQPIRIIFATNVLDAQNEVLNGAGANSRLLSYFDLRNKNHDVLEKYVA